MLRCTVVDCAYCNILIASSFVQVNQLKSAIQIHNESIQFLKRQNEELREDVEDGKSKLDQHCEYYKEIKSRNLELETEVSASSSLKCHRATVQR